MFKFLMFLALLWVLYVIYCHVVKVQKCPVCGKKPIKTGYLKPKISCSNKECSLHNIEMTMDNWTRMTNKDEQ